MFIYASRAVVDMNIKSGFALLPSRDSGCEESARALNKYFIELQLVLMRFELIFRMYMNFLPKHAKIDARIMILKFACLSLLLVRVSSVAILIKRLTNCYTIYS